MEVVPAGRDPEATVSRSSEADAEEEGEEEEVHTAMLWSIQEAVERQTLQIGVSACGATAVVDVLQALGITVAPETADHCVRTRLRRNDSPLPDYLHSRSSAGTLPTTTSHLKHHSVAYGDYFNAPMSCSW